MAGSLPVTIASDQSALPVTISGVSTAAKQDTIIGHVDGIETLLGTIDADTGNIATSTTDLPNVIGTDGSAGPSKAISVAGTEAGGTLQELRVDADGHAQIDVLSSALPTNAAMETGGNLDYLQGIDTNTSASNALLTTIDADTSNISTKIDTLAGAVAGTEVQVDVVASLPAGTNAIGKLAANSGVDIGDVDILSIAAGDNNIGNVDIVSGTITTVTTLTGGGIAHDSADSGNPIKVGARATNAEIAAVANNDRSDLVTTLTGKLITQPYSNPENFVSGAITTAMTGTTSTSLVAAPGSGLRNYITTIIASNAHATVGTDIIIQDGSGGTTLLTIPAAALYGGSVITLPTPLRQPTTNTALFCANVTTGASTKVSAVGYKAA